MCKGNLIGVIDKMIDNRHSLYNIAMFVTRITKEFIILRFIKLM